MSAQESALEAAWYRGAPWLWLLRPLEGLFRLLSAGRRQLYHLAVLATYRAPVPVVVVGNITVGGTGKTPVVIALVEALRARGLRPGVVSRGYGAEAGHYPHRIGPQSEAGECGDEPLLIYRRTGAPCVVDPQRARAVRALLAAGDVDLVISDDGLQHYALERDYEIAVIDSQRRLGNGFCLPAGPLREPPSRLASVDRVLYRGSDDPARGVRYRPAGWVNLRSGEVLPLAAFSGTAGSLAIAGIGQPSQFFATLESLGVGFEARVYSDHYTYRREDFAGLGDRRILMTEKDAVKCRSLAGEQAWFLRIDAELPPELVADVAALVGAARDRAAQGRAE